MKQKDLLFLAISSFIVVVAWIIFNIIHAATFSKVAIEIGDDATPIQPTFNLKVLQALKAKKQITPQYTIANTTPSSAQATQSATVTPTLSPIPPLIATQSATQGGLLIL